MKGEERERQEERRRNLVPWSFLKVCAYDGDAVGITRPYIM